MRKTVDFTEHEIAAIEAKGRKAYHMSFSACLKYCLKDLFLGSGGSKPLSTQSMSGSNEPFLTKEGASIGHSER